MLDLPSLRVTDILRLADWVELSVLVDSDGAIPMTEVARILRGAGLIGYSEAELFRRDEAFADRDMFSDDEASFRMTETIWEELRCRMHALKPGYPLEVDRDRLVLPHTSWRDVPAFTMLLLVDLAQSYPPVTVDIEASEADSGWARLFEKVVEASERGLLGGPCCRFGWPVEPGWPSGIDERIEKLADLVDLRMENLKGKTDPQDKDRGLDVVGRLAIADSAVGTVVLLTQCAAGKNWTKKRGEPSLADWQDILQWNAKLARAVAVPWRLEGRWDIRKVYRYFDDAVILDRPRLICGNPDGFLDADTTDRIVEWCEPLVRNLPRLD